MRPIIVQYFRLFDIHRNHSFVNSQIHIYLTKKDFFVRKMFLLERTIDYNHRKASANTIFLISLPLLIIKINLLNKPLPSSKTPRRVISLFFFHFKVFMFYTLIEIFQIELKAFGVIFLVSCEQCRNIITKLRFTLYNSPFAKKFSCFRQEAISFPFSTKVYQSHFEAEPLKNMFLGPPWLS